MIKIIPFTLGPVQTNTYLIADPLTMEAAVIDPAADGQMIVDEGQKMGWKITQIWLTHAHFDHMAGTGEVLKALNPAPTVALHPQDLPLWQMQGGAPLFGLQIDPGPEPGEKLSHGQILKLGENEFEVRHAPGHTLGHVIFCCHAEEVAFCGDVIFYGSIGRTDLPGGSYETLINSIQNQILTLPDTTRLLSGHGPETSVGFERNQNPFIR